MENNILEMRGISKEFFGVRVLHSVDFTVKYGEIHGLLGENGAGKSTLTKVLCGALKPEEGSVYFLGKELKVNSPGEAYKSGIGMVYQELNLCPHLSVAENMFLSLTGARAFGKIDWGSLEAKAKQELDSLGVVINVKEKVNNLSVAQQQLVAIARALTSDCKILILDEPTSALPQHDIHTLFSVMRKLKERNIAIVFISHKLNEVMEITDRITVLNSGRKVAERDTAGLTEEEITSLIVGKSISNKYPKIVFDKREEIFRMEHLSVEGKLRDISFSLRKGEILGIAGLLGAGKTEVANAIFGVYGNNPNTVTGNVYFEGEKLDLHSPSRSVLNGIGYVTENRGSEGLLLGHSINDNILLAALRLFNKRGFIKQKASKARVDELISSMLIKCTSPRQLTRNLSGGNQQKVVISKWIATQSKLIIFDEPTRGIDVGAKVEIYKLMNSLVEQGVGIIILSSEVPEVYGMADRIIVLKDGAVLKELEKSEVTEHELQQLVM